jgi:hypothetical protein
MCGDNAPGFLNTVPRDLILSERKLNVSDCIWSWSSGGWLFFSRAHHSSSSLGEHAVMISSYSWLSERNTIFQECRAVWHCSPAMMVSKLGEKSEWRSYLGHCPLLPP